METEEEEPERKSKTEYFKIFERNVSLPSDIRDVLVVGGGIAGLTCAYKLITTDESLNIQILEANTVIGGQVGNTKLGDIGGKWFSDKQHHIRSLMKQLGVPVQKREIKRPDLQRCWDIDQGVLSYLVKFELNRYIDELELTIGYFRPGSFDVDHESRSMYSNICNRLFFNKSRLFMSNVVRIVTGADARQVSYLHFMSICYTCGGLLNIITLYFEHPDTLLGLQSQQLFDQLTNKMKYVRSEFNCKVTSIRQNRRWVEVTCAEQPEKYNARFVVIAIPYNKINEISFEPPLPEEFTPHCVETKPHFITCFIAKYPDGHWREKGYSGSFVSGDPFIIGYEYKKNLYSGIIVHEEGLEDSRNVVLQALSVHFGRKMLKPIEYHEKMYELTCLPSKPFTKPFKRIIWSSSSTSATWYRGCLGGAVQSGMRAATDVMYALRPQRLSYHHLSDVNHRCHEFKIRVSEYEVMKSKLNLYNVTYYGLFASFVVVSLVKLSGKIKT
ncbi:putative flavin-containing monoamine oxidase AofH [Teleopsis dalmanni]|uniref:putative flavin-containing monoamine oxidase AofH n=1 Tax=Teleopsis dalmanni TaxID=139649 RepID=UPI0018CFE227|nr:putative flavin-containing monoamine oxidase AofH [Teleopsis dalmanni]